MKFFRGDFKKIRYFATLGLGVLSMVVATVGTLAWFQASSATPDPDHLVEAGSSDFTINSIDGLKSVRQVDGSGYPTITGDENSIARQSATESDTTNTGNTTAHTDFDTPSEGVGYYLVTSKTDYKYNGGYRMATNDDLQNNSDKLSVKNVYLENGWFIDIRRRYFAGIETKDEFVTEISSRYDDTTAINASRSSDSKHNNEQHFQVVGATGYYDVYVTSGNKLHVTNTSTMSTKVQSVSVVEGAEEETAKTVNTKNAEKPIGAKREGAATKEKKDGVAPKKAGTLNGYSPSFIYLQINPSSWWLNDNAWFAARFGTNNSCYWAKMDEVFKDVHLHRTTVPDGTWTKVCFYRMNPGKATTIQYNDSDNLATNDDWGNSGDLTLSSSTNICYAINASSSGSWGTSAGLNIASSGGGWSTSSNPFSVSTNSDFLAIKRNVSLSGNEEFKVVKNGGWADPYAWSGSYSLPSDSCFAKAGDNNDNIKVNSGKGGNFDFLIAANTNLVIAHSGIAVTLNKNNGSGGTSSVTASYGSSMPSLATAPTRGGYTFTGYYDNSSGGTKYYNADRSSAKAWDKNVASSTLYAHWDANKYTVTFDPVNEGSTAGASTPTASKQVTYGEKYGDLPTPSCLGWHFDGWFTGKTDGTEVTSDTTVAITDNQRLYAHWSQSFKVTLNGDDETTASSPTTFLATKGSDMPASPATVPTKTDFTFGGYYDAKGGGGTQYLTSEMASAHTFDKSADTTLYAKWTMNGTITLQKKSGTGGTSSITNQVYNAAMTTITAPTRTGYDFAGYWTSENDNSGTMYYDANGDSATPWVGGGGDTNLYAHWTQKTFTVHKSEETNGTLVVASSGSYNTGLSIGWSSGNDTGYNYALNYVKIYSDSGFTNQLGSTITSETSTTFTMSSFSTYYSDIYIKLNYTKTAKTYTVTLDDQDAASPTTHTITTIYNAAMPSKDTSSTTLSAPTRSGYTFAGYWSSTGGGGTQYYAANMSSANNWNIDSNTTLYAKWTKSSAITLDEQGATTSGTKSIAAGQVYNAQLSVASITKPSKTGYTFQGYYTGVGGTGRQYINASGNRIDANLWTEDGDVDTLYAKWTKESAITLDNQGVANGSIAANRVYNTLLPNVTPPTRTGYTFGGYFTDTNGSGTQYINSYGVGILEWTEAGSVSTLYAKWTAKGSVVTLNENGGSAGNVASVSAIYDQAMPALTSSGNLPEKTGYNFLGFFDDASGGTKYYNADGTSAKSWNKTAEEVTLYAHWEAEQYTVTFDANEGTGGPADVTATYGSSTPTTNGVAPHYSGKVFLGYYNALDTKIYDCFLNAVSGTWTIDAGDDGDTYTLYAHWADATLSDSNKLYAVFEGGEGDVYLYAYSDTWTYYVQMSAVSGYSNVFEANVPAGRHGAVVYRGGTFGKVNEDYRTDNPISSSSFQSDTYGVAHASGHNGIYIDTTFKTSSIYYKFEWITFAAAPAKTGYYFVPIGTYSWSTQMKSEGVPGGVAFLEHKTVAANTEFQIWRYTTSHEWLIYESPNTTGSSVVTAGTKGNRCKIASAGTYDIYMTNNGSSATGIYGIGSKYVTITFSILNGESSSEVIRMGEGSTKDFPHKDGSIGANSYSSSQNNYFNDFSINVKAGDKFRISSYIGTTTTANCNISIASGDSSTYLTRDGSDYKVLVTGRYTIYWTSTPDLVLAPVPTLGNGYYIMSKGSTSDTTGFDGGVKMAFHSSEDGAYFTGYYSNGTQVNLEGSGGVGTKNANTIYIRSYVNGVDKLYTTVVIDPNVASSVKQIDGDASGIIRLGKEAFFNIRVSGGKVYIGAFTVDDQFDIDSLISGKSVEANYTSIVYEIKYTLTAADTPVRLYCEALTLDENFDWKFYAPQEQITSYTNSEGAFRADNSTSPYYVMRQRYFDGEVAQSESETITGTAENKVFYCYLIVDYKTSTSGSIPMKFSTTGRFRITCAQYPPGVVSSSAVSSSAAIAICKKEEVLR